MKPSARLRNFGGGRDDAAFFRAARDAGQARPVRPCRGRAGGQPARSAAAFSTARIRSSLKMAQTELHRIDAHRARDRVHVHLARVVVRGGRQPAIRALPQRRIRRVELDALIGRCRTACGCRNCPSCSCRTPTRRGGRAASIAALTSMTPRGPEVAPHEFFRARPHQFHRPLRRLAPAAPLPPRARRCVCRRTPIPCRADDAHAIFGKRNASPARRARRTDAACPPRRSACRRVHSATAARGSSGTCAMYGIRRSLRAYARRLAHACATSPVTNGADPPPSLQSRHPRFRCSKIVSDDGLLGWRRCHSARIGRTGARAARRSLVATTPSEVAVADDRHAGQRTRGAVVELTSVAAETSGRTTRP